MPDITLNFPAPINVSVQPGDTAYYVNADTVEAEFTVSSGGMIELGPIKTITPIDNNLDGIQETIQIVVDMDSGLTEPTATDFIFFSKDRNVNEASIVGYYSKFRFGNNSKSKAEMFAVGSDVSESSK
jgi:hypothetical protein